MKKLRIVHGDCMEVMAKLPEGSFNAIATDPPYGLEFMGKEWDHLWDKRKPDDNPDLGGYTTVLRSPSSFEAGHPAQAWHYRWAVEALRVLKPGGHVAAMGGTRTVHRLTCALEDAGFEIRDTFCWMYLSGFCKGANISKHIDLAYFREHMPPKTKNEPKRLRKHAEWFLMGEDVRTDQGEEVDLKARFIEFCKLKGWNARLPCDRCRGDGCEKCKDKGRLILRRSNLGKNPNAAAKKRQGGFGFDGHLEAEGKTSGPTGDYYLTSAATDKAAEWDGWHTGLMPSWEPIVLARKPLAGTVAANALKHGAGPINVDGCRIGSEGGTRKDGGGPSCSTTSVGGYLNEEAGKPVEGMGRWPANVLRTEPFGDKLDKHFLSPCFDPRVAGVDDALLEAHGFYIVKKPPRSEKELGCDKLDAKKVAVCDTDTDGWPCWKCRECGRIVPGGERRCSCGGALKQAHAKNPPRKNIHPTVKPVTLFRHLVRLLVHPNGVVLDPFFGSGTTGIAAVLEGRKWVGIEQDEHYCRIARARIKAWMEKTDDLLGDLI